MIDLFNDHTELRAVIDAALEGRLGRVAPSPDARAARLDIGCYAIFGGDVVQQEDHDVLASVGGRFW